MHIFNMKKEMMFLFLIFLSLSVVSAATTQINIETLPLHEVYLYILDPGTKYYSLQSFSPVVTGFSGIASFNYTTELSEFGIFVIVKKNGVNVFSERMDNENMLAFIDIYVPLDAPVVVEEETTEEEEVVAEDTTEEEVVEETAEGVIEEGDSGITGESIAQKDSNGFSNLIYILAVIVLVGIIAGFVVMKRHGFNFGHPALQSDDRPATILTDSSIEDAEKKIEEAEREIRNLRLVNEKKSAAQQKFLEAKRELEEAEGTSESEGEEE